MQMTIDRIFIIALQLHKYILLINTNIP
jgi:hypothetical protein